ncbi:MAG TPA: DUF445 domain-containing protein [Gemmatimonadaceae bacterium]|nr:DUF445 domain-containing protein [Gemmatimonadaceae bacterium]
MKHRATLLLAVAGVVFLVARYLEGRYGFWMGALRATAEASLVGGLADWFAVTALFRHPLGIPIPHTAIVPRRKDRVGRTLGMFVQKNFLSRPVVEAKLRSLRVGERLAEWLSEPANARLIARQTITAVSSGVQTLDDSAVEPLVERSVASRVRAFKVAPVVSRLMEVLTEGDRHQDLFEDFVRGAARTVDQNREVIRERIEKESPWWLPEAVDEKIYRKVLGSIERTLAEIEQDPEHPLRKRFDRSVREFMERLDSSPEMAAKIEHWKEELLATETMKRFSASLWSDSKAAIVRYAERPEAMREGGAVERAITSFATLVKNDPELLEKLNEAIVDVAIYVVERYQDDVGEFIAVTVASWDPEHTSKRVELAIGRDLQFIRINGTLVGGLAGLVLFLVSRLF